MALSIDSLQNFTEEYTGQIKRSEFIKAKGRDEDSQAVEQEWDGASALNTLFINIDSFVKL